MTTTTPVPLPPAPVRPLGGSSSELRRTSFLVAAAVSCLGVRVEAWEELESVTKIEVPDCDPQRPRQFGSALAFGRKSLLAGAWYEDDLNGRGAVYVVATGRKGPEIVQRLRPETTDIVRDFGKGLASWEDVAVVAAQDDYFVFRENAAGHWQEVARLPEHFGMTGAAVAIGPGVIVAASQVGDEIMIYQPAELDWSSRPSGTIRRQVRALDPAYRDFGSALALQGDLLAVGAPSGTAGGAVFVYHGGPSRWGLPGERVDVLLASNDFEGGRFGHAVAFQGAALVVGAPTWGGNQGRVGVFARGDDGGYTEPAAQVIEGEWPGEAALFGWSLSAAERRLLVGAFRAGHNAGAAAQYRATPQGYGYRTVLKADADEESYYFGRWVATNGGWSAIGSWAEGDFCGSVYLYRSARPPLAGQAN